MSLYRFLSSIMKMLTLSLAIFFVFTSFGSFASAQEAKGERKRQTINFEDELIEGELRKPELFHLLQKKQFNFKRLIKLRQNFLPEMERSAEGLRQPGSQD